MVSSPIVWVIYPIHRNIPISKPGNIYFFSGIPPINRKRIDAIIYLKKTIFTGLRDEIKSFTTAKVDPKSKAEVTKAIIAIFLFFKII